MEVLLAKEVRNRAELEKSIRRDRMEASLQTVNKATELLNDTSVLSDIPVLGMTNVIFEASFQDRLSNNVSTKHRENSLTVEKGERNRIEEVTERIKKKILERGWDLGGL